MPRGPILHQRPAKALDVWLAIYYAHIIGYKWRAWSVRPVPLAPSILCGCLAFAFPAVPHFNNRHLRVTCSLSHASTAASAAPSTGRFGIETAKNLTAIYLTGISQRTQVPVRRSGVTVM